MSETFSYPTATSQTRVIRGCGNEVLSKQVCEEDEKYLAWCSNKILDGKENLDAADVSCYLWISSVRCIYCINSDTLWSLDCGCLDQFGSTLSYQFFCDMSLHCFATSKTWRLYIAVRRLCKGDHGVTVWMNLKNF